MLSRFREIHKARRRGRDVNPNFLNFRDLPTPVRVTLCLVGLAALLAGLYGRFHGIGLWPFGVDEYYISRSIDNVMRTGLPQFACGGYYTRGVLYQYLVAGLRETGLAAEFAGRLVAVLAGLAVLPAIYLLARRIQGSLAGWLTVFILCVSIWEIEMSRFARMYAPFQAVFAWYLVFFLRYCIDRQAAALGGMIALSIVGVMTWEGGALLGIANLLAVLITHERGRFNSAHWLRLIALGGLLVLLFVATRDLRGYADLPDVNPAAESPGRMQMIIDWLAPLRQHPLAACGLLLPLGLVVAAAGFIASFGRRWLATAGLAVALVAAALHLFMVTGGVLALLLLCGLIDWAELSGAPARNYLGALIAFGAFWLIFDHWVAPVGAALTGPITAGSPPAWLQHLFGYPDVYGEVIRPWGRALPLTTVFIGVALVFWCRECLEPTRRNPTVAALLSLVVVLVLAVGLSATDRIETRYTYFLYPLCLALAVAASLDMARRLPLQRGWTLGVAALLPLVCFCATEDFQPRQLAHIADPRINFRVGMTPVRASHYYPRNDVRSIAAFLENHVAPDDLVVSGVPNLDPYAGRVDYFYFAEGDERYESYVCPDGRTERWSNHPVLYTDRALAPLLTPGRKVFVSLYRDQEQALIDGARLRNWSVKRVFESPYDGAHVLLITANPVSAEAQ